MSESKRFNIAVDEFEGILWRDYCDDGGYMDANEACKEIAARNEDIGRLQNELGKAKARIAELEFQMSLKWPGVWQPVEDLTPKMVMSDLPDDYAICRKIQPAA